VLLDKGFHFVDIGTNHFNHWTRTTLEEFERGNCSDIWNIREVLSRTKQQTNECEADDIFEDVSTEILNSNYMMSFNIHSRKHNFVIFFSKFFIK
jgi:hypothetical protein